MSPALLCALVMFGLAVAVSVPLAILEWHHDRRQEQAAARVATYVRRQQQAREAEALGRHNLAAVLRGHPAADTVVDAEALVDELEADGRDAIGRAFDRADLDAWQEADLRPVMAAVNRSIERLAAVQVAHAWPLEVSGTGHLPASAERIVLGFDGSRSSDAIVTAAQPAAVIDRTGVVVELYPPTPRPSPRPRPAGSEQHPAGRGRHASPSA